MQKKQKIVFVINEYSFFISHRKNLVIEISKYFEVTIITDLTGHFHDQNLANMPYNILHLDKRRNSSNVVEILKFFTGLVQKINQSKADIVFFVSLENCVFGSMIKSFINAKKSFFIITGLENIFKKSSAVKTLVAKIFKFFLKLSVNKSNADFIFQNDADKDELSTNIKKDIKNFYIIKGNGIDLNRFKFKQRFLDKNQNIIKILFASRLLYTKGVMMIMDISKKITHSNLEYRFSIAGKHDPNNTLSINNEDLMLLKNSKNINFLGEVSNDKIHDLYFQHDIFLLPSIREGIPGAALEAASTGMPLLLSNVPGCKECISLTNSNGALFEVNSLDSLEKAIVALCRKRENLIKNSFNSRKHVEDHFSVKKISKEYLKIIYKK